MSPSGEQLLSAIRQVVEDTKVDPCTDDLRERLRLERALEERLRPLMGGDCDCDFY